MRTRVDLPWSRRLANADASDDRLAFCSAEVPELAHQLLWRHRARRGGRSWLCSRAQAVLKKQGAGDVVQEVEEVFCDQADEERAPTPERILVESFDYFEVCSGPDAPLSAACEQQGLRVGPRID